MTFDFLGKQTPQFMVWPFGWPRPLWILLMRRQPWEGDLISGLVFVTACNMFLYGLIVYFVLMILSLIKRKPLHIESPPPPF
jgi:hypothetical protein